MRISNQTIDTKKGFRKADTKRRDAGCGIFVKKKAGKRDIRKKKKAGKRVQNPLPDSLREIKSF